MYEIVKAIHLLTIAISAAMLTIRYGLIMADSAWINKKFFKIFPHINDTLLLLSGVALIAITGFIPFTPAAPWLTDKLMCVLAYIALGVFAIKMGKNKLIRSLAFFGALGWLAIAGKIAVTKAPFFFS